MRRHRLGAHLPRGPGDGGLKLVRVHQPEAHSEITSATEALSPRPGRSLLDYRGEKQRTADLRSPLPRWSPRHAPGDEQELREAAQTELQQLRKRPIRYAGAGRAGAGTMFFAAEKRSICARWRHHAVSQGGPATALTELQAIYAPGSRGALVVWRALQLRTSRSRRLRPRMLQVKPLRLTRAALETLSIIATAADHAPEMRPRAWTAAP